jgi:peptide/nickel transport system substrate-binding protein
LPRLLEVHYPDQVEPAALQNNLHFHHLTPDRYSFLVLNQAKDLLASPEARRALSLLWDRAKLAQELHRGLVRPIGAPTFGDVPAPPFDREGAIALLETAGYRDSNGDGVRDRAGAPIHLSMLVPTGSPTLGQEAKAYALALRRAGLLLDLVPVDATTLMARVKAGTFDLAPLIWEGQGDEDPRPLFASRGEFNHTGSRSIDLDHLLDRLPNALGPRQRRAALQRIAETLARDLPVLFLYRHDVPALTNRRVHDLVAVGDELDLRDVWVTPPL